MTHLDREIVKLTNELDFYESKIKKMEAMDSFIEFTKYTFPGYRLNWHNIKLAEYLDKFAKHEIQYLIIELPPRHGKSELVSRRLPAFILGRNPEEEVISCSYASGLAQKMNRDVQRIMDSKEYFSLFPDTRLSGSHGGKAGEDRRTNEGFAVVGHRG